MNIKRRVSQAEVPSMAMGDIAFNLIIFFVVLARAQDDSHLQWQPASGAELQQSGGSMVSVVIDNENKIYLNGEHLGIVQLPGRIEAVLDGVPVGERKVLVKIHRDANGQFWGPVLEAIGAAGGEAFLVLNEETQE